MTIVLNSPTTSLEDERSQWFQQFDYTGALGEIITLRTVNSTPLGTATADDVWGVLVGLQALKRNTVTMFHRTLNWARTDRRPHDPQGILSRNENGPLTDVDGNWLPGRREIVLALLDFDPEDEDSVIAVFTTQPFSA